jgi:carboxylesterase type B
VSDVLYEFETIDRWRMPPTAEDLEMARTIHACWVRFIKSETMNCPAVQAWPRYTAARDALMDFEPGGPKVVEGYRKAQLDLLEKVTVH